ncbi:MAG: hypothetical protein HYW89_03170 [Candidatus Sungiibacteriota bacterium]|uniref:Uncharacterized protein n=1 Tax=Candidatus Sungiibacteriota bacterium TaxID=2750080 RepID=A0A7T5UQD6_9BACT|nr:MAG: hypothetical protein HYW89_03170 [Candidatus Sungbacteria bacterium]
MRKSVLVWSMATVILIVFQASAHEDHVSPLPKRANETLSCTGGVAFVPDTARGEGTILVIITNRADYRLRLMGSGIFKESPSLDPRHCLKRFIHFGKHRIALSAFRLKTYPWFKSLEEWFDVGGGLVSLATPNVAQAVVYAEITNEDIVLYSVGEHLRKNWFKYFSIASLYLLTLLTLAGLLVVTRIVLKLKG